MKIKNIILSAIIALGFGLLLSSLTSKYRDLTFVLGFGIQLWMFATPIVYPLSIVPDKYQLLLSLNPMTPIVESFKLCLLGNSAVTLEQILIGFLATFIILTYGYFMFNKMEKNFIDTV